MSKNIYVAILEKSHILDKDIKPVLQVIDAVRAKEDDAFQCIAISISGYDDTPVELWETKEVREWMHKLINQVPYLFYYIENEYYETQKTLMLCMNNFTSSYEGERLSPTETIARGINPEERPQHAVRMHIHQKSYRTMCAEIRKHARLIGKSANGEKAISQMNELYGMED